MIEAITKALGASSKELATFIIAMMPVLELRASIPYGLAVGLGMKKTIILSICGNIVPIIPTLFLLEPVVNLSCKWGPFKKFFDWLFLRTRAKADIIEKYEALGLAIFVGIPLPGTGAWTGCIAASLFKMRFRYAFLSITAGVLIAAAIVALVCQFGKGIIYNVFVSHH